MILARRPLLLGLGGLWLTTSCAASGQRAAQPPAAWPPGFPEIAEDGIAAALAGSVLSLSYRLPAALVERLGPRPQEATVVVAVESRGAGPRCHCLGGGGSEAPSPVREGASVRFHARADVQRLLELPGVPAVYYVHAALFQHRSPVLRLSLGG